MKLEFFGTRGVETEMIRRRDLPKSRGVERALLSGAEVIADGFRNNAPYLTGNLRSEVQSGLFDRKGDYPPAAVVGIGRGAWYWIATNLHGSSAGWADRSLGDSQKRAKSLVIAGLSAELLR